MSFPSLSGKVTSRRAVGLKLSERSAGIYDRRYSTLIVSLQPMEALTSAASNARFTTPRSLSCALIARTNKDKKLKERERRIMFSRLKSLMLHLRFGEYILTGNRLLRKKAGLLSEEQVRSNQRRQASRSGRTPFSCYFSLAGAIMGKKNQPHAWV